MKKYLCSNCGLKQKIKEQLMVGKHLNEGDRAVKRWFSTCARCKKNVVMLPLNKE